MFLRTIPQNYTRFCEKFDKKNTIVDGVIASDERHILSLWGLRERISLALKYAGVVYKYDLSLPVAWNVRLVQPCITRSA